MRLTKQMYGHEFKAESRLFDLLCGQTRASRNVHNGGWYNKAGEKLGWGDLDAEDFRRISMELEEGELFVVLHESDSFWNFVTGHGVIGAMCTTKPDVHAPGVEYVAEKCCYIVSPLMVHFVDRFGSHSGKETVSLRDALVVKVLSPEKAKELILAAGKK